MSVASATGKQEAPPEIPGFEVGGFLIGPELLALAGAGRGPVKRSAVDVA